MPLPGIEQTNPVDLILPDWHIIPAAHHNVRAICDLEGLDIDGKLDVAACVMQESGFQNWYPTGLPVINHNFETDENGEFVLDLHGHKILLSTDWGICQYNDNPRNGWIGQGHPFATSVDCVNNPELAVRLMARYRRDNGHLKAWSSYGKDGKGPYLKYRGKV